jgi:DNA topoisomerase-2
MFTVSGNKVIVDELPIGRYMHNYDVWLKRMREKKIITDYINLSTNDKAHFEIKGFRNPNVQTLRLKRSFGMSNMVLLDMENHPIKYQSVTDILETFYHIRLPYYDARRSYIIDAIREKIDQADRKAKFITAFIKAVDEGKIVLGQTKTADIIKFLESLGFKDVDDMLKGVNLKRLTGESVQELMKKIADLKAQLDKVTATTAEQMWLKDLEEFIVVYKAYFEKPDLTRVTGNGTEVKGRRKKGPAPLKKRSPAPKKAATLKVTRTRKPKAAPEVASTA